MSLYPSDGDIKFGWDSFGRSFAIIGTSALVIAAAGFWALHASPPHALGLDGQLLATAAEWIGGALAAILAFAAWGSIRTSLSERGGVEITPEGVHRIFAPGKTDFLPRDQIDGMMGRPFGGVLLIDRTSRRDMIIPRSIEGYRDCIAELKAVGIKSLPADQRWGGGQRKRTFFEKIQLFVMCLLSTSYASSRNLPPGIHHILGVTLLGAFSIFVVLESRKSGRFQWGACLFGLLFLSALLWWRW